MKYIITKKKPKLHTCVALKYLIFGFFGLIYVIFSILKNVNHYSEDKNDELKDFLKPKTLSLKNILEDGKILEDEKFKKIFFIETHMDEVKILDNPRIACSVESAGKKYFYKFNKFIMILIPFSTHESRYEN